MKIYLDKKTGHYMTAEGFKQVLENMIYGIKKEIFGELDCHVIEIEIAEIKSQEFLDKIQEKKEEK